MSEDKSRKEFESFATTGWVANQPVGFDVTRHATYSPMWPGQYCRYATEVAWAFWQESRKEKPCKWRWDSDHEKWDTECGHGFLVLDDLTFWPRDCGLQFCPYCGGRIEPTKPDAKEPAE